MKLLLLILLLFVSPQKHDSLINLHLPQNKIEYQNYYTYPNIRFEKHNVIFFVGWYDDELWYNLGMFMDIRNGVSNETQFNDVMFKIGYQIRLKNTMVIISTLYYTKDY